MAIAKVKLHYQNLSDIMKSDARINEEIQTIKNCSVLEKTETHTTIQYTSENDGVLKWKLPNERITILA